MQVQTTPRQPASGFTLVEILVSTTVLLIMLGIVVNVTNQVGNASHYAAGKIEAFQNSRLAFDAITRAISGATLNTYYDYYDASTPRNRRTPITSGAFIPEIYGRCSELEFVCGKNLVSTPRQQVTHSIFFQTPLDYTQAPSYSQLQGLLNVIGFYIEFHNSNDPATHPWFVNSTPRYRYRLMELLQPTENFSTYNNLSNGATPDHSWFLGPISSTPAPVRLLAENIIALVITPILPTDTTSSSLSPDYEYDSNIALATSGTTSWDANTTKQPTNMNQLPPAVRVVMIAIDERSMIRLQGTATTPPDLGFDYSKVFHLRNNADPSIDNLQQDINTVSAALSARHINFRIFQSDIAIRGAKWSQ